MISLTGTLVAFPIVPSFVIALLTAATLLAPPKAARELSFVGHFAQEVHTDPNTGSIAWREVVTEKDGRRQHEEVFLLPAGGRKLISLGRGSVAYDQVDSGAGLVSVRHSEDRGNLRTLTFRMKDGSKVGEAPGHLRRIGRLFQSERAITDLNGNLILALPKIEYRKPIKIYIGNIIWDGKRRLSIRGRNGRPNDTKDVVNLGRDWSIGKGTWLSDYAMGFDGLVGNPDQGSFAIFEASNRTRQVTGIYTKDLERIGGDKPLEVTDIGPRGILARNLKYNEKWSRYEEEGAVCLDPATGRELWRGQHAGRWFGSYVLDGDTVVDGRSGRTVGRLGIPPRFDRIFGSVGNRVFVQRRSPERIEIYRLR